MRQTRLIRPRLIRLGVLVALAGLLAGGCGTRWSKSEREAVMARYASGTGARVASGANGSSTSGGTSGAGGTGSQPTGSGAQNTTGVATAGTSGGGTAGATQSATGPKPCEAASSAPGVTDSDITIGTVNSLSGPVPGLGSSHLAATQAYVAYRNSLGGICGRQIKLRTGDDGGDNANGRAIVADMEPNVLAMVGGVAGGMDGGAEVVDAKRIPVVGTSIVDSLDKSPTFYNMRPLLPDYHVVTPKYRWVVEQGARKVAIVYVNAAAAPREAEQIQRPLMEAAGMQVVLDLPLPLTTLSYDSAARSVANSGAEYLLFIHEAGGSAAMAQSLADIGYKLKFAEYIVAYGSNFPELAGSAAEGATSWLWTLPNEDGGTIPEQAAYLNWMAQIAPDSALDSFAATAWAGTKALLDTIEALPGAISRDALLAQLDATTTYDAGGFLAPIELGPRKNNSCLIGVIYQSGAWRRLVPSSGFLC